MLVSPTEPAKIKALGKLSSKPEQYGCDILVMGKGRRIGVQRKKFPEDFVSSLSDGRLESQLPLMTTLEYKFIVLEGYGRWTSDGELIAPTTHGRNDLSMRAFRGLVFSIMFEFGVPVLQVKSIDDTVEMLDTLQAWVKKDRHLSLKQRPGPKRDTFGSVSQRSIQRHILQGFPGIGVGTAEDIIEHFGRVPLSWDVDEEGLMAVKGVGKITAKRVTEVLGD